MTREIRVGGAPILLDELTVGAPRWKWTTEPEKLSTGPCVDLVTLPFPALPAPAGQRRQTWMAPPPPGPPIPAIPSDMFKPCPIRSYDAGKLAGYVVPEELKRWFLIHDVLRSEVDGRYTFDIEHVGEEPHPFCARLFFAAPPAPLRVEWDSHAEIPPNVTAEIMPPRYLGDSFQPRFQIRAEISEHFNLVDLKIGRFSQFVAEGEIPAAIFNASEGVRPRLSLAPVRHGDDCPISVHNTSKEPRRFVAELVDENTPDVEAEAQRSPRRLSFEKLDNGVIIIAGGSVDAATRSRRAIIPFKASAIAKGERAYVLAEPHAPGQVLRVDRVILNAQQAGAFRLLGFGIRPSVDEPPSLEFPFGAAVEDGATVVKFSDVTPGYRSIMASPGEVLALEVENISGEPHELEGGFICEAYPLAGVGG